MIHHQPTKYHHANPLTHFLNLHTSHATAAAAAALALATDGLSHGHHAHHAHPHHQPVLGAGAGVHHLQSPTSPAAPHHTQIPIDQQQRRPMEGTKSCPDRVRHCARYSQSSRTDDEEEQDENSNDKNFLRVLGGQEFKSEAFDSAVEPCQDEGSESEHNIDIDVDDPDDRRTEDGHTSQEGEIERLETSSDKLQQSPKDREGNVAASTNVEREDNEVEKIATGGTCEQKAELHSNDPSNLRARSSSPCTDTNTTTAVLDTDGFVGKSFTIAAILGLRKKQDEAAAAAAAVAAAANEYNEGAMNLSTGAAGFQQHQQQHQQRVAAAAVAAAAMGRLPLVMAAAAAGMEKRDRADSVDSVDACHAPLAYGGQQPPAGTGPLTALQNLHQLPGLHGAVGGSFSAFHPSGGGGGGGGGAGGGAGGNVTNGHSGPHQQQHLHHPHHQPHHHQHHHHHHPHQVSPHFGAHHFHHHQAQGQQLPHQQQHPPQQQHQHLQHHAAHQQQLPAGHHIALGPHHHGQNHNREKFKELGKKTSLSTTAASLKSKRVRTIFTPEQLERLEAEFERQQYMVGPERLYLAHTLQLTEAQVKVWFQNRRIKWRKHHLEITQQRLALIRQRQIASGVPLPAGESQSHLGQQQQQQGGMSGGRMMNGIDSPELTICTDSMDARSVSDGDD